MKKVAFLLLAGVPTMVSAQGLFDIAPNDEAIEDVRLNFTAGVRLGYDSNTSPSSAAVEEQDSTYLSAYIGASSVSISTRNTLEFYANYSANYYNDPPVGGDDLTNNFSGGVNYVYRFNERVRFSSRTHLGYELEPDYNYGLANTRAIEEYFFYSSDNSFGYKFSDRIGAYFGLSVSGVLYGDDISRSDVGTITPYTQFRYQYSPRTVLTAGYRASFGSRDTDRDSTSHIVTVGAEQRISATAVAVIRAGVQFYDVDGGESSTSPFFEAAYRASLSESTSFRAFAKYEITDYDTAFGAQSYDVNNNYRMGIAVTHRLRENVTLNSGLNVIFSDYEQSSDGLSDEDSLQYNLFIGMNYKLSPDLYLDATVNHTIADSDVTAGGALVRDYDRTRASIGVSYSF
jgi:hypothetical protein